MNRIILIKEFKRFKKVTFYTLRYEESNISETDKFLDRFMNNTDFKEDFDDILNYIEEIGERGAEAKYFRFEGKAEALPPKWSQNKLRLYCIRLTDNIVILANGGIKSSQTAQDSKDLSMKFHFANKAAKELTECIMTGQIKINHEKRILEGEELELYI